MSTGRNVPPGQLPPGAGQAALPVLAVLFVDPDMAAAERLASGLRGRCPVAVVGSGQAAQAAIAQRIPDLIVTELDLPDANGLELIKRLRSTPATRHVLFIVVTRRTAVRDKIAAFQVGADDYLVKPVDPDQFETHMLLVSKFRKVIPN
ncbi:MAG TPA: response regulator [Ktedonobacterales bacterium]|jgi:DNA-binding response OmpR family regulator